MYLVSSPFVFLTVIVPMALSVEFNFQDISKFEDCGRTVCISKCCPVGQLLNITTCAVPSDKSELWKPTFYDDENNPLLVARSDFKFVDGMPDCESFVLMPHENPEDKFYLLTDGNINVPLYKKNYAPQSYCIEKASMSPFHSEEVALLCFDDKPVEKESKTCSIAKEYIYPVLLMVSCVFLTITLFVYVWIPELRGKLHGRCLLSMVSSLLTLYILMTIVQLASEGMSDPVCLTCAFLKQLTLLSSFFWLNVMCFDIWRSLKSMRPAAETSAKSRQRFLLYSIYAWGSPLLITSITMVMQNLDKSYVNIVKPNFLNPKEICWFETRKSLWLYAYMIILILVSLNTIFFLMVAYILLKSRNNQRLQRARSQNRDRLWLCGKIFLVMGITWITEVISWQQGTCEAWIFTDIINALQGFTIFLVFVCKKSTRQMVTRRVSKMKSNFSNSSSKSKRSTFFASLSQTNTQNTNSSVISHSNESQSLTRASSLGQREHGTPMTVIQETENSQEGTREIYADRSANVNSRISPEPDEDCPSIPEEHENQEQIGKTSVESLLENTTELPFIVSENPESSTNNTNELNDRSEEIEPKLNGLVSSVVEEHQSMDENDPLPPSLSAEESIGLLTGINPEEKSESSETKQQEEGAPLLAGIKAT